MVTLPGVSEPLLVLYQRSVLAALERQFLFDGLSRDEPWTVDLSAGKLVFELQQQVGEQSWPIQILGTQGAKSSSWLWAWANASSGIPKKLLRSANQVRKYGEKHSITELTTAEQPLNGLTGHFFALVAGAIGVADAYFAAPYEGGTAFLLIDWPEMRTIKFPPLKRAMVVIPRGLSTIPIPDHLIAVREYLKFLGLTTQEQPGTFLVLEASTPVLRIGFDKQGRMTKFKALVGDVTTPIPAEVQPLLPALD